MTSNIVLLLPAPRDCYLPAMPLLSGEVYRYENESDVVPVEKYWNYVGATENPLQRIWEWNCSSSDYAGPKIASARKNIPSENWKRFSFPVFDTDPERLKSRLKEYAKSRGLYFNPGRLDAVTHKPLFFDADGRPDIDDKAEGIEYITIGNDCYWR